MDKSNKECNCAEPVIESNMTIAYCRRCNGKISSLNKEEEIRAIGIITPEKEARVKRLEKEDEIRKEFLEQYGSNTDQMVSAHQDYMPEEVADWWLNKMKEERERIIDELESNPNEDGSISPNIQHWIEKQQSRLRKLY